MRWAADLVGVAKSYDHRPVLRGVDLRLRVGETIAVLGANGSGKSTLLRLVATLATPTRGTVTWFEQPVQPLPAVRRRIGLLPHESLLYDNLTVEENLRFFAGLYGLAPARVESVLSESGLLPLRGRRARILSRGQRQQVDLARALLHDPELLILDEPFTGLDLDAARRLTAMIRAGSSQGRTVIFATHDLAEARALASGAAVLVDGRLTGVAPPDTLDEARLAAWFHEGRR